MEPDAALPCSIRARKFACEGRQAGRQAFLTWPMLENHLVLCSGGCHSSTRLSHDHTHTSLDDWLQSDYSLLAGAVYVTHTVRAAQNDPLPKGFGGTLSTVVIPSPNLHQQVRLQQPGRRLVSHISARPCMQCTDMLGKQRMDCPRPAPCCRPCVACELSAAIAVDTLTPSHHHS